MIEKARQDLETTSDDQKNQNGRSKRSLNESKEEPRSERDVIRLRNQTEDKKAFRRTLTSADPTKYVFTVQLSKFSLFILTREGVSPRVFNYNFPY